MQKSLAHSTQNSATSDNSEISIYAGELTKTNLAKCIIDIKRAFPELPASWYELFTDRILDLKFNDDRLRAAVNFVIDNHSYKLPNVSLFLSFDSKIKTYSYYEAFDYIASHGNNADCIKPVRLFNFEKPVWCTSEDIAKYNLILWNPENNSHK